MGRRKAGRSYQPKVEGMEPLSLLSLATGSMFAPALIDPPPGVPSTSTSISAWDAALESAIAAAPAVDAASIRSGLGQLDRYLGRAWYRAGISTQAHEDCTQAVYVSLLNTLGRPRFDGLLAEIGREKISGVLARETPEGPDFFRAVDTVKKRAQREKSFQVLDDSSAAGATSTAEADGRRGDLHEAIDRRLSPREAALMHATLQGETPAEIADRWGVAPKTVSNEKTRALAKLRMALSGDSPN